MLREAPILRSRCGERPPVLRSRQADVETHITPCHRRALPGSAHMHGQHPGLLCHSLPPSQALPRLFCHGDHVRPFHFNGEYPESQPHNTSNPLRDPCLENPVHRGAWQATVHGVAKRQTRLRWPSMHPTRHWFSIQCKKSPPTQELTGARLSVPASVDRECRGGAAQGFTWLQTRCHQRRLLSRGWTVETPDRLPSSSPSLQRLLLSQQQTRLTDGPTGRSLYKAPESQNDTLLSQSLFSGEWEEPRRQLLSQGTPPPQTPPA